MASTERCFELLAQGDGDGLRRLLEDDPATVDARDGAGVSLLMQCVYRGRRDLAATIASKRTIDIFEAASLGHLERLKECARDASEVNALSKDGFTALHFACFFGQPEAARFLIESGAAVDAVAANPIEVMPLHSAASACNLEAARLLLEHGAPVNARQQGGWTPIHAAARNGDRALVELLLQHGADPRLTNDEGKTPAAVAQERGHREITALLEN